MKTKKFVFVISVLFLMCCFMATGSWAARKIDIHRANAMGFIGQMNKGADLGPALGLSAGDGFQLLRTITDLNGETHYRYQQTFKGFPVWGMQTIVSKRNNKVTNGRMGKSGASDGDWMLIIGTCGLGALYLGLPLFTDLTMTPMALWACFLVILVLSAIFGRGGKNVKQA